MKYEDYYYYKVDVMSRSHGYSFMVRCKDELSDEEVISRARDSDIRAFKDCTTTV